MTVLDASLALDLILGTPAGKRWAAWTAEADLVAPDHLLAECGRVLRRLTLHGGLDPDRAELALRTLLDLPLVYYPTRTLAQPAFDLRANFGFDDALYVALASQLGEDLACTDRRLHRAVEQMTKIALASPA